MYATKISLSAARINAGLTQVEAAKSLGVSRDTLSAWEKRNALPRIDQAYMLSALYKMPIENLKFF